MLFVSFNHFTIQDLIESLRGTNPEINPKDALNKLLARFLSNIGSWALTTKIFIILHRSLQDVQLGRVMAIELKSREHLLHHFQKKSSDTTYEAQMYSDLSLMYANYIKHLITFKTKSDVLNSRMSEANAKLKNHTISEMLFNYENFDALVTMIFGIFEH